MGTTVQALKRLIKKFNPDADVSKVDTIAKSIDLLTEQEIGGGIGKEEVQSMIDTSIEGKQDVLTAGEGIAITDNTISLKGWKIYTDNDWSSHMITNNVTNNDYLVIINMEKIANNGIVSFLQVFIPKNVPSNFSFNAFNKHKVDDTFYRFGSYGVSVRNLTNNSNFNIVGDGYSFHEYNGMIQIDSEDYGNNVIILKTNSFDTLIASQRSAILLERL